jgi:hypothetical protein
VALDGKKGDLLWRFETGGVIDANPISYMSEGKAVCGHCIGTCSVGVWFGVGRFRTYRKCSTRKMSLPFVSA